MLIWSSVMFWEFDLKPDLFNDMEEFSRHNNGNTIIKPDTIACLLCDYTYMTLSTYKANGLWEVRKETSWPNQGGCWGIDREGHQAASGTPEIFDILICQ